jgi:hypothetical protein
MNPVDTNIPLGFVGVGEMGSRIIRGVLAAIVVSQHSSHAILWRKLRQKPRWVRCLATLGLCLFVTAALQAQMPDPTPLDAPQPGVRPPLTPFPRFEDWSFLRDPSLRVDPYDRLKFIPLNDSKTNYLTFGLESRTEFQYLSNNNWGAGPQNPGVVLERLMPDIDLRLGDHANRPSPGERRSRQYEVLLHISEYATSQELACIFPLISRQAAVDNPNQR